MTNKTILEAQIGALIASMGEMQKLADTYFEENGGYVERDTNAAIMPDSHEDVWNTYCECIEILYDQIKSLRAQAAAEQPDERGCECKAIGETLAPSTYWVIERGSPTEYFTDNHGNKEGNFTSDISKSPRWTEEGAKSHAKELESWGVKGPLRACEHMDCTGPEPTKQPEKEGESNVVIQEDVDAFAGAMRSRDTGFSRGCADLIEALWLHYSPAHHPDSGEWQWVPKEPTEAMLRATRDLIYSMSESYIAYLRRIYATMLLSAPKDQQ